MNSLDESQFERRVVWTLKTSTLGDLFQTPIKLLPMEEFLQTQPGNWVEENAEYIFWNVIKTNLYEIEMNIYADFNKLNAMTYELKFGHLNKSKIVK
jgi:hypothetical protein